MCPPRLHITLGIFYRLYTLLEEACHKLDLKAQFQGSQAGASYHRYISALRQQRALKEDEERLVIQVKSERFGAVGNLARYYSAKYSLTPCTPTALQRGRWEERKTKESGKYTINSKINVNLLNHTSINTER